MSNAGAYVFVDGQNFYLSAKTAFGLSFPNFDIAKIGNLVSRKISSEDAKKIHFYTGMPVARYSPRWHEFWTNKIDDMEAQGIEVFTRPLRYQYETDPASQTGYRILSTREKGIDLRLALDVLEVARRKDCSDIIILSRDQDFREVVDKIKMMSDFERRTINIWSAFPADSSSPHHLRGIDGTRELIISREDYSQCIDLHDYRGRYAPLEASGPSF